MQARNITRILSAVSLFIIVATASAPSQAVPAFARQTGKACNTCHFQHFPILNAYGREFKAAGYVDMGKEGTVKGRNLSIPDTLNASIFFKVRYQKSNGKDLNNDKTTASGELQFPDEFALLIGGRVAENVGFMLETQLVESGNPNVGGFKMPFMYEIGETKIGAIPFTTDGLGAPYGFEVLSTGAVRNIRIAEHRAETSAQQYVGLDGSASGLAFVLWDPRFFVNLSKWSPNHAATAKGNFGATPNSNYARAAFTPSMWDWDFGIGAQYWGGASNVSTGSVPTRYETKATAFDAQAQGVVGGMPLGIYLTHAKASGSSATGTENWFNQRATAGVATGNVKASVIAAELGVLPGTLTIMAAYRDAENGATTNNKDKATTLGLAYQYAQNLQLQLQYSERDKAGNVGRYDGSKTPGDKLTTLMLTGAF